MTEIKFLVFADLHYKKKMYATATGDLEEIYRRATNEKVDFILHEGDVCNDYGGSPELRRLLEACPTPYFGVYGNHELETAGNSMQTVTPYITNRPDRVVWGSEDGKTGDGAIAYYYYDTDGFRFLFLDTNYSVTPEGKYEHNREGSWGRPAENTRGDSLGDVQLAWLDRVLTDAAEKGLHCVVNSHAAFCGRWQTSPDHTAVRMLFAKANALKKGTVLMAINGHYHTNRAAVVEDVFYLDVNTAINGWWQGEKFHPYAEKDESSPEYTFDYTDYDEDGNAKDTVKMPLSALRMGAQTLFFESPLSATVTVTSEGSITVNGTKTKWRYGIAKDRFSEGTMPEISDHFIKLQ